MFGRTALNDFNSCSENSGPVHFGNDTMDHFTSSSVDMQNNTNDGLSFIWNPLATSATSTTPLPQYATDRLDNSMIWTNPYPKKKADSDRGTAVWGDPNKQGPIRRWKVADAPVVLPPQQQSRLTGENNGALSSNCHNEQSGQQTGAAESACIGLTSVGDEERDTLTPKSNSTISVNWLDKSASNGHDSHFNSTWLSAKPSLESNAIGWDLGEGDAKTTAPVFDPFSSTSRMNGQFSTDPIYPRAALTRQIADQLKRLVNLGLLDGNILQQNLSVDQLETLNQFLLYASKLERAQNLYARLQPSPNLFTSHQRHQQELLYLSNEIKQLIAVVTSLKQKLQTQTGSRPVETFPSLSTNGQSKLHQWRLGTSSPSAFSDCSSISDGVVPSFRNNASAMWSDANYDSASAWPASNNVFTKNQSQNNVAKDFNDSIDDAAVSAFVDAVTEEISDDPKRMDRTSTPLIEDNISAVESNSGRESVTTPTLGNTFDASVPEFVPGQPWMWRDPKELAADPDATPSSLNLKKAALSNGYVNDKWRAACMGINAAGSKSSFGFTGANVAMNENTGMNETGRDGCSNVLPNGYLPSSTRASPWTRQIPPYSAAPAVMQPAGPQSAVCLPILQLSQSLSGHTQPSRVPYAPMKLGAPAAVAPYVMAYNNSVFPLKWVVLSNLNMIDEHALQMMLSRVAPLCSCINMPGAGIAAVKFKDVCLEKIMPRLHAELSAMGVVVQLAKDEEISLLLQSVNGP